MWLTRGFSPDPRGLPGGAMVCCRQRLSNSQLSLKPLVCPGHCVEPGALNRTELGREADADVNARRLRARPVGACVRHSGQRWGLLLPSAQPPALPCAWCLGPGGGQQEASRTRPHPPPCLFPFPRPVAPAGAGLTLLLVEPPDEAAVALGLE